MGVTFNSILEKYRKISFSEKDKGERFERLMKHFLLTDPKYANQFHTVWMWNEFPGRKDLGGNDTGIDLVAITKDGDYWAIQCKCYAENTTMDKPSVDSFLATSGRNFTDDNFKTNTFKHKLWISTSSKWGANALEAFKRQDIPVSTLQLNDLINSDVDWKKIEEGIYGEEALLPKKNLRKHQIEALAKANEYFKTNNRGKLIMACGTGKTFTALKIAENETNGNGLILFLVPSIALLGQTLNEWFNDASEPINAICICSDPKSANVHGIKQDIDMSSVADLPLPASTDVESIINRFNRLDIIKNKGLTVVFSTYQSIDVISKAQEKLAIENPKYSQFDLIICDEAHRTTGAKLFDKDESAFTKVHDNSFLKAKKRLYMTATPRLYTDISKTKAAQTDTLLCSMDDVNLYGEDIYRISFGEAVDLGLLTDYKVIVLTLNEYDVPPSIQNMIMDKTNEINSDDASKLIGCINALSKQILGDEGVIKETDPEPMKRAVAFCGSIPDSEKITKAFNTATETYISQLPKEKQVLMQNISSKHVDGTMNAAERNEKMNWLKDEPAPGECRILTNVRCLSEGVDVPSLDAVLFLSPRNSEIDVVQSVGRVMRRSKGKNYGYIIIPILVPSDIDANKALDNNEKYKVVWSVLNALRAHDERFKDIINKIDLNTKRPHQILIGTNATAFNAEGNPIEKTDTKNLESTNSIVQQMLLHFEQIKSAIFGKMVLKVGDKDYWEQWAKSVADIASRQIERITRIISENPKYQQSFQKFLEGLHKNINSAISEAEAIEMLSQHIITKPVFDALFENYSFVKNNPMSQAMQHMLDTLEEQSLEKDTQTLKKFYDSVKQKASGIDNAEGKQRIILKLYDNFFKTAFPKMVEKLGIVYTPVEVVDFIIHSVNDILKKEFNRNISDHNVHILDPFTGTGTFITRLLQSGLIKKEDLLRKYTKEIHCNEIVLLAYYIAAVNIESTFHELLEEDTYKTFEGICLTDTFQLSESEDTQKMFSYMFPLNSQRVVEQQKAPLKIIIGNPPYSVGQKSGNDNAQNQSYPKLDKRIAETYAKHTNATNKNSLYDSYIKAFRWSSDRLDKTGGIICFVSNGAWLDGNSTDGFRKSLEKEFSSIYVFNLRGNQRTSGELSRREGGKIFGSGSRTPISITLLVKNPAVKTNKATIYYHDIGDYLNREDKLKQVSNFKLFSNLPLQQLQPNEHGDWISLRNDAFESFIKIGDKDNILENTIFKPFYSRGLATSRDAWCYNSSKEILIKNINKTLEFYNEQRSGFQEEKKSNNKIKVREYITYDDTKFSWSDNPINGVDTNKNYSFDEESILTSMYRPFFKQKIYFNRSLNERVYQLPKIFPVSDVNNLLICVPGIGNNKGLSVLISNVLPDLGLISACQCFPLYYYEENTSKQGNLFDNNTDNYIRRDAISDFILGRAIELYGKNVTKEDIFYYVYGFLHNKEYREIFANDLKKMLPRIPLLETVKEFWDFSKAGRQLAELHLNYENIPPHPDVIVSGDDSNLYTVEKMRFLKKDQKDTILYNNKITISNIPPKAYEYVVNGKSAIDWIIERYQITTHKESGITNNPNHWATENNNPRYILDLLLSIINLSTQTVDIVNNLPKFKSE